MDKMAYQVKISCIATATALVLTSPQFDNTYAANLMPADSYEYEPLAEYSKTVSEALASSIYTRADPEFVFSLLTEVATRLIHESKPLDRDLAAVVQKEFWNLLQ
jgi:hypothetical protein